MISPQQLQHPFRFIEVAIKQCRNGGIDCKVHGIQLIGRSIGHSLPLDDTAALARLLPPDFEFEQVKRSLITVPSRNNGMIFLVFQEHLVFQKNQLITTQQLSSNTRVFVWGLNDKEQLGGPKGSKVKLPQLVDAMSALQPISVAGGSKSLFLVTSSGKVKLCSSLIFFTFLPQSFLYCFKVFACGEGSNGRLGLGHSNSAISPQQVTGLSQHVVLKVAGTSTTQTFSIHFVYKVFKKKVLMYQLSYYTQCILAENFV